MAHAQGACSVCPDRVWGMRVDLFRAGHWSLVQGVLAHASRKVLGPGGDSADGNSVAVLKQGLPCYLLKELIAASCSNEL